jgi:hypothetical protein
MVSGTGQSNGELHILGLRQMGLVEWREDHNRQASPQALNDGDQLQLATCYFSSQLGQTRVPARCGTIVVPRNTWCFDRMTGIYSSSKFCIPTISHRKLLSLSTASLLYVSPPVAFLNTQAVLQRRNVELNHPHSFSPLYSTP